MESKSHQALMTVDSKISHKGLPVDQPYRDWALEARRRRMRNSLIYRDWLKAEDKEAAYATLAERWELEPGHIRTIIEKMKVEGAIVPALAAETRALRVFKRAEVIDDFATFRDELAKQIEELEVLYADGERMVVIEEVDENAASHKGEYNSTKSKKVRIASEIMRLKKELASSHQPEAAALESYTVKEAEKDESVDIAARANAEFVRQFIKKSQPPVVVETTAEVVQ